MPPMSNMLYTDRLLLRPWSMDDAPQLPLIANTRDITWNTSYRFPYPYDDAAAQKFLRYHTKDNEDQWLFAIFKDSKLIGGCGCERGTDIQQHVGIIGYWLGVEHWGNGFATEALTALIGHIISETNLEKLTATVFGWNPASRRVLEKCGFVCEGISKDGVKKWDRTTDLYSYGRPLP